MTVPRTRALSLSRHATHVYLKKLSLKVPACLLVRFKSVCTQALMNLVNVPPAGENAAYRPCQLPATDPQNVAQMGCGAFSSSET